MLHLTKLAVGARDVAALRAFQRARSLAASSGAEPPLRHRTRNAPRRAAELVDGGSIYWVVAGAMLVRQLVLDVVADHWEDGTACAGLVLDPSLVAVEGRPVKAFQGWRYLEAHDAPPDLAAGVAGQHGLPDALALELRRLCLL